MWDAANKTLEKCLLHDKRRSVGSAGRELNEARQGCIVISFEAKYMLWASLTVCPLLQIYCSTFLEAQRGSCWASAQRFSLAADETSWLVMFWQMVGFSSRGWILLCQLVFRRLWKWWSSFVSAVLIWDVMILHAYFEMLLEIVLAFSGEKL